MPLSTSSSDERLPAGPWGKTWAVALLISVVVLGAAEAFWRSKAFNPSLIDDMDLWAMQRSKVPAGADSVVIIGSSRNQADIATDVVRRELPGRTVVQLAVTGGRPLAVLRDLAEDESFQGTVLCDLLPTCLLAESVEGQAGYVRNWERSFNHARQIERALKTAVQTRVVIDSTQLKPALVVGAILGRKLPAKEFFHLQPDRSRRMDFREVDTRRTRLAVSEVARRTFEAANWPDAAGWIEDIHRIEGWIDRIQQRGGKVVLLRHVSSDESRQLEDQYWPRDRYWDVLASKTKATAIIHFEDVPGMAAYKCPDGSHLDYPSAVPYTEALMAELKRKGVFTSR